MTWWLNPWRAYKEQRLVSQRLSVMITRQAELITELRGEADGLRSQVKLMDGGRR
jgi:hypothetical protein